MKYAICNETFQDWPFEKAFQFARQCGYQALEIAPFTINKDVRQITAAQRATVREQAEEAGLSILGLHWLLAFTEGFYLTSPEADVRRATTAYLEDLARFCHDLGGDIMVLGSPHQRNVLPGVTMGEAMGYAADILKQCMPTFADLGIRLALEPLGPEEGDFLLTADLAVELMEMVDAPPCRLHLDVKAMSTEAQPIDEIIRQHSDHLIHFHANDANRRGPGMGEIDFVPILQALKDVNYDGWVCVEVFDYDPGVEALAKESIDYLKSCV
ncbi:MAG: sugar phosphate isomerase/epimerase family protein [Pirellulaceae bacterium]